MWKSNGKNIVASQAELTPFSDVISGNHPFEEVSTPPQKTRLQDRKSGKAEDELRQRRRQIRRRSHKIINTSCALITST